MSQLWGEILRQWKNNAIKQNINIVVSTLSDSEKKINTVVTEKSDSGDHVIQMQILSQIVR